MDRTEGNSPEYKPLSAESLSAEARDIEQQLRQFQPAPLTLDRDRLMFLAGQAAAHSAIHLTQQRAALVPAWLWPASTAGMTTLAACLTVALTLQMSRHPAPAERVPMQVVQEQVPGSVREPSPQPAAPQPVTADANKIAGDERPALDAVAANTTRRATVPVSIALPAGSVLRMRNVALTFGLDALPQASHSHSQSSPTPSTRSLPDLTEGSQLLQLPRPGTPGRGPG